MYVYEENLDVYDSQELNLEPKVNWGGIREKGSISVGKLDSVGSTRNAILVHPSVRS